MTEPTVTTRDGVRGVPSPTIAHSIGEYARGITAVAVVAGFALVGLTQMGLDWFYGHFGLAPQDVGLNQASILFETAATGVIAITAAMAIGMTVALVVHRLRRGEGRSFVALLAQPSVVRSALGVAVILLAAFFLSGILNAHRSLADVRAGRSVTSQTLARGEVVARCTEVWWKDPHLGELVGRPAGARLVYLGESGGVTSFYDAVSTRTVRVPTGDIATRSC